MVLSTAPLTDFVVLVDDRVYDLLTLCSIGTYVFLIFEAYPYLLLTGGTISRQSESHPCEFRKVELLPLGE